MDTQLARERLCGCRPPTRDVRDKYREKARQMLLECGVPGVLGVSEVKPDSRDTV